MAEQLQRWPADQVGRQPVDTLIPYARTHSDAQVAQIAASIQEWGWTTPVLVDEAGTIIAGHGRVLAAQRLGLTSVPVVVARGWSEAKRRAYVLADNKLALNAGWDIDLLRGKISDLGELDFDLGLTGFGEDELSALLAELTMGLTDPDDVPAIPEVSVSRLGDVWRLGHHRLACGDSTDPAVVQSVLGGVRPHLMVTDPPCGVEYDPAWRNEACTGAKTARVGKVLNDNRADWREAWALFPGEVAYVWHGALHATTVAESLLACGFDIRAQIIWAKERLVMGRGHHHWQHEPCWYAVRSAGTCHWSGNRKQTKLWSIPSSDQDATTTHGTQKPVECMRRPIENNSSPGQAVYEPFSGSGTTLVAAEMTGRICHAVELSPAYVDVAVQRCQAFTGEQATREADGRAFDGLNLWAGE